MSSSTATPSTAPPLDRRTPEVRAMASSPENKFVNFISVPAAGNPSICENRSSPPCMLTSLACPSAFMSLPPGSFHRTATGTSAAPRQLLRRFSSATCCPDARLSEVMGTFRFEDSANRARLPIRQLVDADLMSKLALRILLASVYISIIPRGPVQKCQLRLPHCGLIVGHSEALLGLTLGTASRPSPDKSYLKLDCI